MNVLDTCNQWLNVSDTFKSFNVSNPLQNIIPDTFNQCLNVSDTFTNPVSMLRPYFPRSGLEYSDEQTWICMKVFFFFGSGFIVEIWDVSSINSNLERPPANGSNMAQDSWWMHRYILLPWLLVSGSKYSCILAHIYPSPVPGKYRVIKKL